MTKTTKLQQFGLLILIALSTPLYAMDLQAEFKANNIQITTDPHTGLARFIHHPQSKPIASLNSIAKAYSITTSSPQQAAHTYLGKYSSLFGIKNSDQNLILSKQVTGNKGGSMLRYQQKHKGIPIIGAEIIVNLDNNKQLTSINGRTSVIPSLKLSPSISHDQAKIVALQAVTKWHHPVSKEQLSASEPELSIYDPKLLANNLAAKKLVWKVEVTSLTLLLIREFVLVDALSGGVVLHFNQIDFAKDRETYTANGSDNEENIPGDLVCNEADPSCINGSSDAKSAHDFAGDTYDYFFNNHGQDGIDGNGLTIISTVHFGQNYKNAFWTGNQVVYGDGLAQSDDLVGHELSHGYIERSSNLYYFDQSGAINESFADLWGEFIDLTNGKGDDSASVRWIHGEDDAGIGIIRSSKDPTQFNHPDKMSSEHYYTGTGDNNGVHSNSGVNNKASYLMVDGDTFNNQTITGIGISKVSKIYYEAQTKLLTKASTYADLYVVLNQACSNLIATADTTEDDCIQVKKALDAVEMNTDPVANIRPQATLCPATKEAAANIYNTSFEGEVSNWEATQLSGETNTCVLSTANAKTGQQAVFCENINAESNTSWQMKSDINLSADNYLYFAHDFLIEPDYDIGKIEYSLNAGSSWISLEPLHGEGKQEVTVDALGSGFSGHSLGYVSSRYNLSSLSGETIRFRFRVESDEFVNGTGWTIDDFTITQCARAGTTPDAFNFTDQQDVERSTQISSNIITIAGLETTAPISISGDNAKYSINGGSFSNNSPAMVQSGDTVQIQHTSSAHYSDTLNSKLNIGGLSDTFSSTTSPAPSATASLPSGETIKVTAITEGTINSLSIIAETNSAISDNANNRPANTDFPYGFISYSVQGVTSGATVQVEITYPSIPTNPKMYKVDSNGFSEYTRFTINGNIITLALTDGGEGDADGVANGEIIDLIGLANPITAENISTGSEGGNVHPAILFLLLLSGLVHRYKKGEVL